MKSLCVFNLLEIKSAVVQLWWVWHLGTATPTLAPPTLPEVESTSGQQQLAVYTLEPQIIGENFVSLDAGPRLC